MHIFEEKFARRRAKMRVVEKRMSTDWRHYGQETPGSAQRRMEAEAENAIIATEALDAVQVIIGALTHPEGGRFAASFDDSVASGITNGRNVRITSKPLFDNRLRLADACTILAGLTVHEIGHIHLGTQTKSIVASHWPGSPVMDVLGKMLDDVRIDANTRARFPGLAPTIRPMRRYLAMGNEALTGEPFRFSADLDLNARVNFAMASVFYTSLTRWVGNAATRAERTWWLGWAERVAVARTDSEVLAGLVAALRRVTPPPPPPPQPEPESEPTPGDDGTPSPDDDTDDPMEDSDPDEGEDETDQESDDDQSPQDGSGADEEPEQDDEAEDGEDGQDEPESEPEDDPEPDAEADKESGDGVGDEDADEGEAEEPGDDEADAAESDEGEGEGSPVDGDDDLDDDDFDESDDDDFDESGDDWGDDEADAEGEGFDGDPGDDDEIEETEDEVDSDATEQQSSTEMADEAGDGSDLTDVDMEANIPDAPTEDVKVDVPDIDEFNEPTPQDFILAEAVKEERKVDKVSVGDGFGTMRIVIE